MRFLSFVAGLAIFSLLPITASAQYYDVYGSLTDAFLHKDGPLQVTYPSEGFEHWVEGNTYTIRWTADDLDGTVDIYLIQDAKRIETITSAVPIDRGSYSWTVPKGFTAHYDNNEFGDFAWVRVVVKQNDGNEYDTSDNQFVTEPAKSPIDDYFSDVPASHPNAAAIEFVRAQGMVAGYGDGTYRPDATINRAEFVKILTIYKFDLEMVDMCGSGPLFTDVFGHEWFAKYVCRARDAHLVSGYPDGSFKPEREINFAEAAKIIATTDTFNAGDPQMPEHGGGPWYSVYVQYLGEQDAIPLNIVSADQLLTRGDMAEILYLLKAKPGTPSRSASDLIVGAANVCTDGPIDSRIGAGIVVYPKKEEYAKLEYLGEVLTAYECGKDRFEDIYGDASREVGPYPFVMLWDQPSSNLRALLEHQGYACFNEHLFHCTQWEHPGKVSLSELIELGLYAKEIDRFNCPNCY